jgi:hypothetical protein
MIPKTLHFTHFWEPFPGWALKNVEEFRQFNPDFEIRLWSLHDHTLVGVPYEDCDTAGDCLNIPVPEEVLALALTAPSMRFKSDLIRMYLLHKTGGIYLDVDTRPYKPFDNALLQKDPFLCNKDKEADNHFIGSSTEMWPWDDIWRRCNLVEKPFSYLWFGSCNAFTPSLYHILPQEWTSVPMYIGLETYQMLDAAPLISESGIPYIKHYSISHVDGDTDPKLSFCENPNNILLWSVKCTKVKSRKV